MRHLGIPHQYLKPFWGTIGALFLCIGLAGIYGLLVDHTEILNSFWLGEALFGMSLGIMLLWGAFFRPLKNKLIGTLIFLFLWGALLFGFYNVFFAIRAFQADCLVNGGMRGFSVLTCIREGSHTYFLNWLGGR